MTDQTTIAGVEPPAAQPPRNVLSIVDCVKLGRWTPDQDLSQFQTLQALADAAAKAIEAPVTPANMRGILKACGLETKFVTERELKARETAKLERAEKAAPRMLEMLKTLRARMDETGCWESTVTEMDALIKEAS